MDFYPVSNLNELWNSVLKNLEENYDIITPTFNLWFRDLTLIKLTDDTAFIGVENNFKFNIVSSKFVDKIKSALLDIIGFEVGIIFISLETVNNDAEEVVESYLRNNVMPSGINSTVSPFVYNPEKPYVNPLNPEAEEEKQKTGFLYKNDFTFDNFVVGDTNKFAHAAALGMATDTGVPYNPLFIHGASGLGKTHLLYAIANEVLKKDPNKKVLYVRGEEFTNEMIEAISQHRSPIFREIFRNVDVLLMDDIQFIAGKTGVQEEFFNTFDTLYSENKKIVLASDRPPKDIQPLEERLKTRFEWGLLADVQPPNLELRLAILKNKAENTGINISYDVMLFLAENIKSNIRQIEGAVRKLYAFSIFQGLPIDMSLAKSCISDIIMGNEPINITIDKIFTSVSKKFNVSIEDIKGKKQTKDISRARHYLLYVIRRITDLPLEEIGKQVGQHHTTVIYGINKISEEVKINAALEREIDETIKEVRSL